VIPISASSPDLGQQPGELVLDHVGQCANHHQRSLIRRRQARHQGRQARVLALGEGGFYTAARIVKHAHLRPEALTQARCGARQVELDHLGRARPHQEQAADVAAALQQAGHDPVEFVLSVSQTSQITLVDDGRGKAGLGEDHHPGRRLDQVCASTRAHHEKERILDLAVQPDDAGQAAEHFTLATFLEHHRGGAARTVVQPGPARDCGVMNVSLAFMACRPRGPGAAAAPHRVLPRAA